MAVEPRVIKLKEQHEGLHQTLIEWLLKAGDDVALPSPVFGHRNDKTIDLNEAGVGGWGTATIEIHGNLYYGDPTDPGFFKLLNGIPDTFDLTFDAADSMRQYFILPNVTLVKPVRTTGTLGAEGVRIALLVMSDVKHFR